MCQQAKAHDHMNNNIITNSITVTNSNSAVGSKVNRIKANPNKKLNWRDAMFWARLNGDSC